MVMSLCKSFPTSLGLSQENSKHGNPLYLPPKLTNLLFDRSSEANNSFTAPESDNSDVRLVELPSSMTENSETSEGTALEISSKFGIDNIEGCSKKSEDYGDSWSLCQPEKSFESLLGGSPLPAIAPRPCSLGICPVNQNSRSNPCGYSLQFCTENLGFESSEEREDCSAESFSLMKPCGEEDEEEKRALQNDAEFFFDVNAEGGAENVVTSAVCVQGHGSVGTKRCGGQNRATASTSKFPPPLPSIARNGQQCVFLKPLRKDGRFLLQEVKVPRQEFLHASRQDGRLRLQLVRNHDDPTSLRDDGDL